MKQNILLLLFLVYCSNISLIRAKLPKVCLNRLSCVVGELKPANGTKEYESFLGIPFAKPPIGKLRFSNPVEAKLWRGTLVAKSPKPDCIQKNYISESAPISGSEDCLYLNVYRPKIRTSEQLPVLFYIHGGGFLSGSPSPLVEGPEYFMETEQVILVAPAYRLGLFGFLSTDDEEMTGNFALKDQNLALKWVNKYIAAFGGDPDRVTIFGHSAGAASVHFHMLSSASQGLFQNAILMSGAANAVWAKPVADPKGQVIELAEAAGIRNAAQLSSRDLVKALRKINKIKLLTAADKFKSSLGYPLVTFRPNIESPDWPNSFLTLEGFHNSISVPWIIGNVPSRGEGLVMALRLASNPTLRAEFNKNFTSSMSAILELTKPDEAESQISLIVNTYMDGVFELNDNTLDGFLEMLGDAGFIYPTMKTIWSNLNAETFDNYSSAVPVWISETSTADNLESVTESLSSNNLVGIINFNYRGPYSLSPKYSGSLTNFSVVHGDDALFLFKLPLAFPSGYPPASPEETLVKRYVKLYVDFAKTGTVDIFEEIRPCTKDSLELGTCEYLSVVKNEDPFQIDSGCDVDKAELWESVYD